MTTCKKPVTIISLDEKAKEKEMSNILFYFQIGVAIETGSMLLNYAAFKLQYYCSYAHYQDLFFGINAFTTLAFSAILLYTIFLTIKKKQPLDKSTFFFLMTGLTLIAISQINVFANDVLLGRIFYGKSHSFSNTVFNAINITSFYSSALFWVGVSLILAHFIYKRANKISGKTVLLYPALSLGMMMAFTSAISFLIFSLSLGMSPVDAIVSINGIFFSSFYRSKCQLIFQIITFFVFSATCASICTEKKSQHSNQTDKSSSIQLTSL